MNVPDAAVYASLPMIATGVAWVGRQFIFQTIGKQGNQGNQGNPGPPGPVAEMTVRDYRELSELLCKELNGRYMLASEAREKFESIEAKLDTITANIVGGMHPES